MSAPRKGTPERPQGGEVIAAAVCRGPKKCRSIACAKG